MRKDGLKNRSTYGKHKFQKETSSNLPSLCKWIVEQGLQGIVKSQTLGRSIKGKNLWRVIIGHVPEGTQRIKESFRNNFLKGFW